MTLVLYIIVLLFDYIHMYTYEYVYICIYTNTHTYAYLVKYMGDRNYFKSLSNTIIYNQYMLQCYYRKSSNSSPGLLFFCRSETLGYYSRGVIIQGGLLFILVQ